MVEDIKQRAPGLIRNTLSLAGVIVALVALANMIFLLLVDVVSEHPRPYLGIFAYMIFPGILGFGAFLIAAGLFLERRRRKRLAPGEEVHALKIDFGNPRHRNAFVFLSTFLLVFLFLTAVGSMRAYEFTDSVQFCGQLCHTVMKPEFTAYLASPHARVRCVDCHVGPGATWYVKSKMSGMRQVYYTMRGTFPRPIPSPVENLRPAQQTCEQCHWPAKFYGGQFKVINHFGSDEKNTPRQVRLLIKTGGGSPTTGTVSGIHWHMNIANEVTYVATDRQRQVIPYIRVKDRNGRIEEYFARDAQLKPEELAKKEARRMDCVDCHNRPTHIYIPPDRSVDDLLTTHKADPTLPFFKQQAVAALTQPYKTTDEGVTGIANALTNFYETKYPDVYKQKQAAVQDAVAAVQKVFQTSFFPEMKLDWRTHPNNIGHFYSAGCFRCHDGNHATKSGKVLSKDCRACHEIISETDGSAPGVETAVNPVEFKHPGGDLGDLTQVNCADCHGAQAQ
ncbi:MAG: NapC/NirT family cytochrome c [Acidobacteriia bacterium]|nr:NapC/NirT family cytochrome c [Terriglobia bacterium]